MKRDASLFALSWRDGLLALGAGWVVLVGSLFNYLTYGGHPILDRGTFLAAGFLLLLAAPTALLAVLGRVGVALATFVLVFAAVQLNQPDWWPLAWAIAAAVLAVFLGSRPLGFLGIIFAVVAVSAFLSPSPPLFEQSGKTQAAGTGTPLIHIVLDEAGGDPRFSGFRQWPDARSTTRETRSSLKAIYDPYFDRLRKAGYATEVWQTSYAPFCEDECLTYNPHRIAAARGVERPVERAKHLLYGFSALLSRDAGPLALLARGWRRWWTIPPNAAHVMDLFAERARTIAPGEALVLHVVLPHAPYVLDEQCSLLPMEEWHSWHEAGTSRAEQQVYQRRQLACAEAKVEKIVAAAPEAIVIVHSDHGDRLVGVRGNKRDDHLADYRAYFGLRIPGDPGGLGEGKPSLPALFDAFADTGFTGHERD